MTSRRKRWTELLNQELEKWRSMPTKELLSKFASGDHYSYLLVAGSEETQVNVQVIRPEETTAHVIVRVDDGSLPQALVPVTGTFSISIPENEH